MIYVDKAFFKILLIEVHFKLGGTNVEMENFGFWNFFLEYLNISKDPIVHTEPPFEPTET